MYAFKREVTLFLIKALSIRLLRQTLHAVRVLIFNSYNHDGSRAACILIGDPFKSAYSLRGRKAEQPDYQYEA